MKKTIVAAFLAGFLATGAAAEEERCRDVVFDAMMTMVAHSYGLENFGSDYDPLWVLAMDNNPVEFTMRDGFSNNVGKAVLLVIQSGCQPVFREAIQDAVDASRRIGKD